MQLDLPKQEIYENHLWPNWLNALERSPARVLLVHGIMGSELRDRAHGDDRLWLDAGIAREGDMKALEFQGTSPNGSFDQPNACIYARRTVEPPVVPPPYSKILSDERLRPATFCYDWRDSVDVEALRLGAFLDRVRAVQGGRPIRIVTHSMGGHVLLRLLSERSDFADLIERIIFCAPPFHGALVPLRVVERGDGMDPALDLVTGNHEVKEAASTFLGLLANLVAPKGAWPANLPGSGSSTIDLAYPIRTGEDLYVLESWSNQYRYVLRSKLLALSRGYHTQLWATMARALEPFEGRAHVIAGLNGKTPYAARRIPVSGGMEYEFLSHTRESLDGGPNGSATISNGDGTVLFQSTYLPCLPTSGYYGCIPAEQGDTHGGIVDRQAVRDAIVAILDGKKKIACESGGDAIVPYKDFIGRINWTPEHPDSKHMPASHQKAHHDYMERAWLRQVLPYKKWRRTLATGDDDGRFYRTRQAALAVMQERESLEQAAARIGEDAEFLARHIRRQVLPLLAD